MKHKQLNLELLKTKSILYIEDEDNIRKELTATLELLFHDVFSFSNAQEALGFFLKNKPDMILSDISLEGMSGLQFATTIRQTDKKIPIILLSAHTDTDFLLQAAKLKLVEYLTKPITFDELISSLLLALEELQSNEKRFIYISNSMRYDTLHKILYENESAKKLSGSETNLLDFLIRNTHRTVTKEEIKNHMWADPYYVTDTAFKSLLHKLRKKIGKDSLKNVSGVGYYIDTL